MPVQSVVFDKEQWRESQARRWLKRHGMLAGKVDETGTSYRFRQHNPRKGVSYSTKTLPGGISLVIDY
jgi:hypothetical protein